MAAAAQARVPNRASGSLGWGRKHRTAARHRARLPNKPPLLAHRAPPPSSIAQRASSIARRAVAPSVWMLGAQGSGSAPSWKSPRHFLSHHPPPSSPLSVLVPRPQPVSLAVSLAAHRSPRPACRCGASPIRPGNAVRLSDVSPERVPLSECDALQSAAVSCAGNDWPCLLSEHCAVDHAAGSCV